jgi:hypothetical protein
MCRRISGQAGGYDQMEANHQSLTNRWLQAFFCPDSWQRRNRKPTGGMLVAGDIRTKSASAMLWYRRAFLLVGQEAYGAQI